MIRRFLLQVQSNEARSTTSKVPRCWGTTSRHCRLIATATRFKQKNGASSDTSFDVDVRVYNSLSEKIEPIVAKFGSADRSTTKKKGLAWYTCGPTVYAPAHLGHARTYVCLDILRRVLEDQHRQRHETPPPLFVLNITDVDDKLLAAAAQSGEPPLELARRYEAEFWSDWDALGCLRPHVVTRVTEHVTASIVPYIQRILDRGLAYVVEDDGVYFDVRAFDHASRTYGSRYGKLAPSPSSEDLWDTLNTFPDNDDEKTANNKRDLRDFCLWKFRKDGEVMYWLSPWGEGRPGWHIECSAMIQAVQDQFGKQYQFAVHAGGIDLKFPHHTNEIAQAEAYLDQQNEEWIPQWVHTGHLHINGLKMSKSLKNFITIQDLLSKDDEGGGGAWFSPADDFRMWCLGLSGSYRGPATYSPERITEARKIRCEKVCQFLYEGHEFVRSSNNRAAAPGSKLWNATTDFQMFQTANQTREACINALYSDLDGTSFVQHLVKLTEAGSAYLRQKKEERQSPPDEIVRYVLRTVRELLQLVGFSRKTYDAGWMDDPSSTAVASGVVGGERALLDEMVRFRKAVRDVALSSLSEGGNLQTKEVLRLCDEARESTFPALGVDLRDGKPSLGSSGDDNVGHESTWSYCIPRKSSPPITPLEEVDEESSQPERHIREIPLTELFRVGQFERKFSAYTEDGFPTHNADGTELSKNLYKKLLKKREVHEMRLAKHEASKEK